MQSRMSKDVVLWNDGVRFIFFYEWKLVISKWYLFANAAIASL